MTTLAERILPFLQQALQQIPQDSADAERLDRALQRLTSRPRQDFFQALGRPPAPTCGIWAAYLLSLLAQWDDARAADHAVTLGARRELHPSTGDDACNRLLDAACGVLSLLGWMAWDGTTAHAAHAADAADAADLPVQLAAAADALAEMEQPDQAYDFLALALYAAGPALPALRERVAGQGMALALAAKRPHQVAVCAMALAKAVQEIADADAGQRLRAFKLTEIAIERLQQCPQPWRSEVARTLVDHVRMRDWLHVLAVPLLLLVDAEHQPPGLAQHIGLAEWQPRVATGRLQDHAAQLAEQVGLQRWELEIDQALHALESPPVLAAASVDPITWTLEHPAHRRAVPHSRSFLRERDFDRHLVELAHEITHVLSYLGHLGGALTCLRLANHDNEGTLWSLAVQPGTPREELLRRVGQGPAPLPAGDAGQLMRAEIGVELAAKARALQDVWTPWLEGLAVFGETAADPAADPSRIHRVAEALRGMVDFMAQGDGTAAQVRAQVDAHVREFEQRCAQAIGRRSPMRLDQVLRHDGRPYFAGYVAVRSVLASWRRTLGTPLHGAQAFDLLLHATRFSTSPAIPDLALPSETFERAARHAMADWVRGLADVGADVLALFLAPSSPDEGGSTLVWEGFALRAPAPGDAPVGEKQAAWIRDRMTQALASWNTPEDAQTRAAWGGSCAALADSYAMAMAAYRRSAPAVAMQQRLETLVDERITMGGLLPIGRTDASFHLVVDPDAAEAALTLQLRTTDAHVETGRPSSNLLWQPIPVDDAQAVAQRHADTAEPRMQVTRVIDLMGLVVPGQPTHLLAMRYGDWFAVRGTTPQADAALQADAGRAAHLRAMLRMRLHPTPAERMVGEQFFAEDGALQRTLHWLGEPVPWHTEADPVDMAPWVARVADRTRRTLDTGMRRARVAAASHAMLAALLPGAAALARGLVDEGFAQFTAGVPHLRSDTIDLLLATARAPLAGTAADALAAALQAHGVHLFQPTPAGWDVCPATPGHPT
ncbi:hypothetical protein [Pseudorhodoferax sp. Leaf274]|uniref:hypothetical protein n=1 Tax=Pseudorhodoferax sp. Leaf274 TaxID=1736318 RepID=UPI000702814B|nr:hypothetical protein [Pseudorhodoferax sp. Leaf274]KQP45019.1 hypothetical protein ASF44_26400 [Pseudorhodoferax sp. Leaf274]